MIETMCHCPQVQLCWRQNFVVLPREGETICRMEPDLDSDRTIMLLPRFAVVDVDYHVDAHDGRVPPAIHLFLMVIDEEEEDEHDLADLPRPTEKELLPQ